MTPPAPVKVLVVEDDAFFSRVLQKRLAAEGFEVQAAADGREGMKLIVDFEPDLVISDWMMPQVDGLELCQSVKTGLGVAAPYFILLTAKGELNDRLLGLQTGADDYLVKPCDQSELMARVKAGVRIVQLSRDLRQRIEELKAANAELEAVRATSPLALRQLPMCSVCHKVRDANGEWHTLDEFLLAKGSGAFVDGVCGTCRDDRIPERRTGTDG
jgi:sigma-B regulation protein RsbU (phosphoserine phosphatase)